MLTAYIQKVKPNPNDSPEFALDITFNAFEGFNGEGIKVVFFEEIEEVPRWSQNNMRMVVADVETTLQYFKNNGIVTPKPLDIPDVLLNYTLRDINFMTLGGFKKSTILPIFVKPHSKIKAFASGVIRKQISRQELFNRNDHGELLDDNMEVLTSEVVDVISEYRCFIKDGKVMGVRHYQGDCLTFPNRQTIMEMVETYQPHAPRAYTLDVGVVRKSSLSEKYFDMIDAIPGDPTVLIECQDMWAVGAYGLEPKIYVSLLKARWLEIFQKK